MSLVGLHGRCTCTKRLASPLSDATLVKEMWYHSDLCLLQGWQPRLDAPSARRNIPGRCNKDGFLPSRRAGEGLGPCDSNATSHSMAEWADTPSSELHTQTYGDPFATESRHQWPQEPGMRALRESEHSQVAEELAALLPGTMAERARADRLFRAQAAIDQLVRRPVPAWPRPGLPAACCNDKLEWDPSATAE